MYRVESRPSLRGLVRGPERRQTLAIASSPDHVQRRKQHEEGERRHREVGEER